jgi:ABC-type Fe3+/spermidine/putrescine transport system ATPase subunit
MRLVVENLTVRYGRMVALNNASLMAESGSIVALLGPSGCGKSTLLRAIAGLVAPESGSIRIGERDIARIPTHARRVGLVFQDYALFTHMDVTQNIEFGLRMTGVPRREWASRVSAVLQSFHLGDFSRKRVTELSGGQQQRVALARTLVTRPDVLLLDEPLSALDRQLREKARLEIRRVVKASGITTVIVTHDQEEALGLADQIVILRNGEVEQCGSGPDLYRWPANNFVAAFMGKVNLISARISRNGKAAGIQVESYPCAIPFPPTLCEKLGSFASQELKIAVRPESLKLTARSDEPGAAGLVGTVRDATFLGQHWELVVDVEGLHDLLIVSVAAEGGKLEHGPGQHVEVLPNWDHVTFSTAGGTQMIGGV